MARASDALEVRARAMFVARLHQTRGLTKLCGSQDPCPRLSFQVRRKPSHTLTRSAGNLSWTDRCACDSFTAWPQGSINSYVARRQSLERVSTPMKLKGVDVRSLGLDLRASPQTQTQNRAPVFEISKQRTWVDITMPVPVKRPTTVTPRRLVVVFRWTRLVWPCKWPLSRSRKKKNRNDCHTNERVFCDWYSQGSHVSCALIYTVSSVSGR